MITEFTTHQRYRHIDCLDIDHIVLSAEKLTEGTLLEFMMVHSRHDFVYGVDSAIIPDADLDKWSVTIRDRRGAGERPYQCTVMPGAVIRARSRS